MKGCLEDLSSQRPLADTLEGVKLQKQWYQVRIEYVALRIRHSVKISMVAVFP